MLKARCLSIFALTLTGFLFASGGAEHASKTHEGGWMEKWLSFDPGLFMWTIVTFLIVLFILKWKAWGPLIDALDIEIFKADHTAYSKKLNKVVMLCDAADHTKEDFVMLSGTRVRDMLAAGEDLPPEFARPEVAEILMSYYQQEENL